MKNQIIVTSSSHMPRFCAGTSFSGATPFPLDHFSAEQLKAIIGDRLLTVVVGRKLEAGDVDDFMALVAELPPEAADIDPALPAEDGKAVEVTGGLSVYPAGSQSAVVAPAGEAVVHKPGPHTHAAGGGRVATKASK